MSPNSWNKLPSELLRRTFHLIYAQAQRECGKQSARWSKEAGKILYADALLGSNLEQFVAVIASKPRVAKHLKMVTFSSTLLYVEDCRVILKRLFLKCQNITIINADSQQILNDIIWPTLLLDSIFLRNLAHAGWHDSFSLENHNFIMIQLKHRQSLHGIAISLKPTADQKPGLRNVNQILLSHIEDFAALKKLTTDVCKFPIFDEIMNSIPHCIQELKVSRLDSNNWHGILENVAVNKQIITFAIDDLTLNELMLPYIQHKFPNLQSLYIKHVSYDTKQPEFEDAYWKHVVHLALTLDNFELGVGFEAVGLPARLKRCVPLMSKFKCSKKELSINFNDPADDQRPSYQGVSIKHSSYQDKVALHLELSRKDHMLQINSIIPSLFKVFTPKSITVNGVASLTQIYNQFSNSKVTAMLMPFFDINNVSDIHYFLTKHHNSKSWRWLFYATHVSECHLAGFILTDLPPPYLPVHCRTAALSTLHISRSIIDPQVLPEISRRLPAIDLLVFHTVCFLVEDVYTLKFFFPTTKLNKLVLHIVPLLRATNMMNKEDMMDLCSLENLDLVQAVPRGKYTFKIETDDKTRVYKRGKKDNMELNVGPKDVDHGEEDDILIWIRCKELKLLTIENGDVSRDYSVI
ncbi:hypothetical protein MBANPS3_001211 [Mucor bainieri]